MSEKENMELDGTMKEAPEKTVKADKSEKSKKGKSADKPSEKKKKPGVFQQLARTLREMKAELKKVSWPSKAQTMKNTGVVIICVIVVGVFVWIFDGLADHILSALLALFQSV